MGNLSTNLCTTGNVAVNASEHYKTIVREKTFTVILADGSYYIDETAHQQILTARRAGETLLRVHSLSICNCCSQRMAVEIRLQEILTFVEHDSERRLNDTSNVIALRTRAYASF